MRAVRVLWVVTALAAALSATSGPAGASTVTQTAIVSSNPVNWTPHVMDGRVLAIVQIGDTIVAGGAFSSVQQTATSDPIARTNIFAFDATDGTIDPAFDLQLDGRVNALATDGTSVFVGGGFNTVDGVTTKKIVKITPEGSVIPGFKANATAPVNDLAFVGGRLYAAGAFAKINGVARNRLARLDPVTGKPQAAVNLSFTDPRAGAATSILKIDVTPDGSTLIAIGNFTKVNGLDRHQIAMIDVASDPATVANWQTNMFLASQCSFSFDTYMRDIDLAPDGSFFAIVTTGAYRKGQMCDTSSRWETAARGTGLRPTWVDHAGGDTQWSVAVSGSTVYTGGHQRWENNPYIGDRPGPGAVPRSGIAALDPQNGVPFSWNPGRTRGVGAFALVPTPTGLWVGSDTVWLGGEYHARIGFFPLAGGSAIPDDQPRDLPGTMYAVESDGTLVKRTFDGTTAGPRTVVAPSGFAEVRGAFMLGNRLFAGTSSGTVTVRTFGGGSFGGPAPVELYGLTASQWAIAGMTGMFYEGGRVHYTVSGEPRLWSRYFAQESSIFGACPAATPSVTSTYCIEDFDVDGASWATAQGVTLAGDRLYWIDAAGQLWTAAWNDGSPGAASPVAGQNWGQVRALFVGP